MKKLFCSIGLHWFYHITWVDHPEGKLGFWYCPTCLKTFNGHIHKPNPPGYKTVSGIRIRNVIEEEVRSYVKDKFKPNQYS